MDPQITAIIGIGLAAMLWRVSRDIRKDHKAEIHQARTELKADIEARSANLREDIAAVRLSVSNLHADQLVYVKPPPRKRRTGRRKQPQPSSTAREAATAAAATGPRGPTPTP